MLFILTGNVQIGKSRWLKKLTGELSSMGVACYGVIAPGVWIQSDSEKANSQGFEKLGIDNMLLPDKTLIRFADRADLAKEKGTYSADSQAGKASLGWHISDDAIRVVNEHLACVSARCCDDDSAKHLLIVDELGRLELHHGGGLVEATKLLEDGPTSCIRDALVVVRDYLADLVEEKYTQLWGGSKRISPDLKSETFLKEYFAE